MNSDTVLLSCAPKSLILNRKNTWITAAVATALSFDSPTPLRLRIHFNMSRVTSSFRFTAPLSFLIPLITLSSQLPFVGSGNSASRQYYLIAHKYPLIASKEFPANSKRCSTKYTKCSVICLSCFPS